jgi:hypothetical protein
VVIELAVDDISSTGDERQVRKTVECWLWSSTGNWSGTIDLCKYRRVRRFLDGVNLNLVNTEVNVNV